MDGMTLFLGHFGINVSARRESAPDCARKRKKDATFSHLW